MTYYIPTRTGGQLVNECDGRLEAFPAVRTGWLTETTAEAVGNMANMAKIRAMLASW